MDQMFILINDYQYGAVSKDTGPFIRFVDRNNLVGIVHGSDVTIKLKEGKPYYVLSKNKKIIRDYNIIKEDNKALQNLVKFGDQMIS